MTKNNKFLGCMFGGVVGDALGTTAEFVPPHVLEKNPVTDLIGQGKFRLEAGMFTDDSSMMLCLCESLLECGKFDGCDQQNRYHSWYREGHLSSNGLCFDIGKTTVKHLLDNIESGAEFHPQVSDGASGNGGLMRMNPVPLFYSSDTAKAIEYSGLSSMTTHPSEISRDCCRYYAALILGAINGATKEELLSPLYVPPGLESNYWEVNPLRQEVLNIVQQCSYKTKNPPEISGDAFVITTMEAGLWAFYHTDNYKDGALKVVNLGDDADTTGCIYGQLAGAFYGIEGIPQEWLDRIALRTLIQTYAKELYRVYTTNANNNSVIQVNLSDRFIAVQQFMNNLETRYAAIKNRVLPCPKMYRSVAAFDEDTKEFEEQVLKHAETLSQSLPDEIANSLVDDFRKRFVVDRSVVEKRSMISNDRANLMSLLKKGA